MAVPDVGFEFYSEEHHGTLGQDAFEAALPEALARLEAITGADVPGAWADRWRHAACALADRAGGADLTGLVASEHVGSTTLTYAAAAASRTDWDAAAPWLAGTGLLCSVLRCDR